MHKPTIIEEMPENPDDKAKTPDLPPRSSVHPRSGI